MVMRIGGLASGMDIDDIVSKMMLQHKAPVNKMSQKLQQLEWKRQELRDINRQILDFRNNTIFNLNMSSTFQKKSASVSGNTAAVSATSKGDALDGTYHVQVEKLATAANMQSGSLLIEGTNEKANLNTTLNQLGFDGEVTFTLNDGESITVNSDTTIKQLIADINKKTSVSAFFDSNSGRIAFQSKETGVQSKIEFNVMNPDNSGSLDQLKDILQIPTTYTNGSNGKVTVNGMLIEQGSNTFDINGTSITVHEVGSATVTTKIDTDSIVDSVKNFVEKYNDLLSTISGKLNEQRYRDFLPLTDEQRKQFKEEGHDVEEWMNKAQSGLLRNDSSLNRLLSDMRLAIASPIQGAGSEFDSLSAIGITQEKYVKGSDKNGNLVIDEAKLRAAIEKDPDALMNLFNQREGTNEDGATRSDGIGEKLYKNLKTALDNLTNMAGNPNASNEVDSLLSKQIINLGLDIDRQNARLLKIESNLYKRFTAMETAIARYASQSAYLMSAFGGDQQ